MYRSKLEHNIFSYFSLAGCLMGQFAVIYDPSQSIKFDVICWLDKRYITLSLLSFLANHVVSLCMNEGMICMKG